MSSGRWRRFATASRGAADHAGTSLASIAARSASVRRTGRRVSWSIISTAFRFREVLFDAATGEALAVGEKAVLMIDQDTRQPVRLTDELRAAIEARLVPA